jgi:hypothetical protein
VRSAQFLKCARGTALLPRLFAHSVYEMHPKLGACIEIAEWPGGSHEIEAPLLTAADCVTATGGDEAIASVRARVDLGRTRFIGHGHRVSFGYVGREMLARHSLAETVRAAVADISAWDQLGCLSPHVLYIETKGNVPPEFFAEELAKALEAHEAVQPRGATDVMTAAAITSRRGVYEVRAAAGSDTLLWQSKGSTAWTVVFEADPRFQASCLHRFIYVKPVENLQETLHTAELVRGKVSTVGLAAIESRAAELARELAHWGVPRICPLGRMQSPPLAWRHDGRPPLAELVEWTDWETE